jgi:hypothetical protein
MNAELALKIFLYFANVGLVYGLVLSLLILVSLSLSAVVRSIAIKYQVTQGEGWG